MENELSISLSQTKGLPSLGERGEALAIEHLIKSGYRIVVANFKVPVGRNSKGVSVTGEIDIIAIDRDTLVFVEVKTRRSDEFTPVITAVNKQKQRQITRTARVYRRLFNISNIKIRYDVVTILMPDGREPVIELVKDHWTEASLRKKVWSHHPWFEIF